MCKQNRRYRLLLLLALALILPAGIRSIAAVENKPVAYVVEIKGTVYWRKDANAQHPIRLDANTDARRPLFPGEQLKPTGQGSLVKVKYAGNVYTIALLERWRTLPVPLTAEEKQRRAAINKTCGYRGGRDRGIEDFEALLPAFFARQPSCTVTVDLSGVDSPQLRATIRACFPPMVTEADVKDTADLKFQPAPNAPDGHRLFQLLRADGAVVLNGLDITGANADKELQCKDLQTALSNYWFQQRLRLPIDAQQQKEVRINLRLLNVENDAEHGDKHILVACNPDPATGIVSLHAGTTIMLELTNTGETDCRVWIYDLDDARCDATLIWPEGDPKERGELLTIPAGGQAVIIGKDTCQPWDRYYGKFTITPPYGRHAFTVLAIADELFSGADDAFPDAAIASTQWDMANVKFEIIPAN